MPTVEFAADLGSAVRWGRRAVLCLRPVIDAFQFKILTLVLSAVALCACKIILLFFVVFCVARAVHKFGFRFVVNETPNRLRQVERRRKNNSQ